ncbi:probable basic-leucine zipper transcription factor S [Prorops nasuta]|uniref:probable basic-leucine zipper transcription factor S n=1 Tax=Prorops nasuta TaxID=863751 RepID=UPI0034D01849
MYELIISNGEFKIQKYHKMATKNKKRTKNVNIICRHSNLSTLEKMKQNLLKDVPRVSLSSDNDTPEKAISFNKAKNRNSDINKPINVIPEVLSINSTLVKNIEYNNSNNYEDATNDINNCNKSPESIVESIKEMGQEDITRINNFMDTRTEVLSSNTIPVQNIKYNNNYEDATNDNCNKSPESIVESIKEMGQEDIMNNYMQLISDSNNNVGALGDNIYFLVNSNTLISLDMYRYISKPTVVKDEVFCKKVVIKRGTCFEVGYYKNAPLGARFDDGTVASEFGWHVFPRFSRLVRWLKW